MAFIVAILLATMGVPTAAAGEPVFLIKADGIWVVGSATGDGGTPTCIKYLNTDNEYDENQVRYGDDIYGGNCPTDSTKQSGFGFDGTDSILINPGETFLIGKFTHYNNPIYVYGDPEHNFKQVDLDIIMDFRIVSSGKTFTGTASYTMNLDETPNGDDPCKYEDPECGPGGCPNENGCCDKVWFENNVSSQTFEIDGVWYTLEITGFVPDCEGSALDAQAEFFTREEATNQACLYGRIIEAAPAIDVTKTANPISRPIPGGDFTFNVKVCNIGDTALTITSLTDDIYGDLNGRGTCVTGQSLAIGECYECSFIATEIHETPWSQVDTVTATAQDDEGHVVTDSDDALIAVTAGGQMIPSLTQWGIIGMVTAIAAVAIWILRRKHARNIA